jgi:uncharacterized protein (DUF427 family)
MSTRVRDVLFGALEALRHEPIEKRIRAVLGGEVVADTTRALLVWEPKRVVPTYAVPEEDLRVTLGPLEGDTTPPEAVAAPGALELAGRPVLDPGVPFAAHTAEGEPLTVRAGGEVREGAAFRPADPALEGYVVLDFAAFDAWYEEDEENVGHPRDPFHRIDIVRTSRHVRVELDGQVLADTQRAWLLFEPPLPVRCYVPPDDVRTDLLRPSPTRSTCAYKGYASYWSFGDEEDLAWSYPDPLREAAEITDCVCFFNERVDVVVDGTPLGRPVTPWSKHR